jgi:glycosyltransferase involved in cell wall biosynthesis
MPDMLAPMRVFVTASSYPADGSDWRSRFISDMLSALARRDRLRLCYWGPPGDIPGAVTAMAKQRENVWLRRLMANGGLAHLLRQSTARGAVVALRYLWLLRGAFKRNELAIDLAHVNWLQNALALWGTHIPAIITVLGSDYGLLRRRPLIARLVEAALRGRRCILAPNANWMVPFLRHRFGHLAEVSPVPFGVDISWFDVSRRHDIDATQRWVVISRVTRKKIGPLLEWGEGLFGPQRMLDIVGPNQDSLTFPPWATHHGPTFPQEIRTRWFPSATGLISLSEHDEGRPQVMLEAMAAALPVIASVNPAHLDIVKDRQTGCLVDSRESFRRALDFLSDPATAAAVGNSGRDWVRREVGTWDDTADRYHRLYERLLGAPC